MSALDIAVNLDRALETGRPADKLAVLELAVAYDREAVKRSMGMFVLDKLAEAYENLPNTSPVRDINVSGHGIDARWLSKEGVRPYTAVEAALGSSFGVRITKPTTKAEYLAGAIQIRSVLFDRQSVSDKRGPGEPLVIVAADKYARDGLEADAYLKLVDYTVTGTPHFVDRVATITHVTAPK